MESELVELLGQTLTVYPYQSFNQYGEATFSTSGTTYAARIEEKPTMVINQFGEETIASHTVYVNSTAGIDLTSRVVLPDGSEPNLIRSDIQPDVDGTVHHVVLFFGAESG